MEIQQFNPHRMAELEEFLEIEYEKLFELERAISIADGITQKVAIRQQIKRDLLPRLQRLGQEYAGLLVSAAYSNKVSVLDAEILVEDLNEATFRSQELTQGLASPEMVGLLNEIRDKLNEPGKSALAKLKVALPIVPLIARYELELDTEAVVNQAWRKVRDFFKKHFTRPT